MSGVVGVSPVAVGPSAGHTVFRSIRVAVKSGPFLLGPKHIPLRTQAMLCLSGLPSMDPWAAVVKDGGLQRGTRVWSLERDQEAGTALSGWP